MAELVSHQPRPEPEPTFLRSEDAPTSDGKISRLKIINNKIKLNTISIIRTSINSRKNK